MCTTSMPSTGGDEKGVCELQLLLELKLGCWEANPDPLEEQCVFWSPSHLYSLHKLWIFGTCAVFSVQLPGALSLSPGCLWPHGPSCCLVSSSYSLSDISTVPVALQGWQATMARPWVLWGAGPPYVSNLTFSKRLYNSCLQWVGSHERCGATPG